MLANVEFLPIDPVIGAVALFAIFNIVALPNKLPVVIIELNTLAVRTLRDDPIVDVPDAAPEIVNVEFATLLPITTLGLLPTILIVPDDIVLNKLTVPVVTLESIDTVLVGIPESIILLPVVAKPPIVKVTPAVDPFNV